MNVRILTLLAAAGLALACDGSKGEKGATGTPGEPGAPGEPGTPGPAATPTPADNIRYEIRSATVAEGAAPTVTFKATDATGVPVDVLAEMAAGRLTPSFVLSRRGADGKYTSYLTRTARGATYVQNGTQQPVLATATQAAAQSSAAARVAAGAEAGVFTYTFSAPVTGVDAAATHRVGIYGNRTVDGVVSSAANTLDFVPAGGAPVSREVVSDAACNRCHTVVNAHGGARRGVKLCLTCHSPQTVDPETGNNVDMALMIHKIHKGKLLANGYTVVGNRQTVHDFSRVAMGPSHATYFGVSPATAGPIGDRGIIRECALCHQGAEASLHQTSISRANCGTCHDDVNFATGENHVIAGVPLPVEDTACASCHAGANPIINVERAHSVNYEPTRNFLFTPKEERRLAVAITSVTGATSDGVSRPAVEFTITLNGQPYDLLAPIVAPSPTVVGTSLGALGFQIAGPITDYGEVFPTNVPAPGPESALASGRGDPAKVTLVDAATGKYRFTFTNPLPAGKTGVHVVSFEAYYQESRQTADGLVTVTKPYAADPIFHDSAATAADDRNVRFVNVVSGTDVTGTGATRTERRKLVDNAKCNNCHEDLGFHGNRSRQGVDYCATCHNPNLSNERRSRFTQAEAVVPSGTLAAALPGVVTPVFVAESVSTNVFIHKIHMGAELSKPYKLGANRTAGDATPGPEGLADFSLFEAPSPMGNCQTCHDPGTYRLPVTPNLLPVRQAVLDCTTTVADAQGVAWCSSRATVATLVTPPQKAVCTSCHDTDAAKVHADLNTFQPNTATAIETCAACHGAGKDFDALEMHPPVLIPTADLPDESP